MKSNYFIQVIDLKHQVDHITPKKIQLFEEYQNDPANDRIFVILIRHRPAETRSDGNKTSKKSCLQGHH